MTTIHYVARVKDSRLLELPEAAEELDLQPGEELEVTIAGLPHPRQNGTEPTPETTEAERIARIKSVRGKYAHLGVSSDDLHRDRAADKEREERQLPGGKP